MNKELMKWFHENTDDIQINDNAINASSALFNAESINKIVIKNCKTELPDLSVFHQLETLIIHQYQCNQIVLNDSIKLREIQIWGGNIQNIFIQSSSLKVLVINSNKNLNLEKSSINCPTLKQCNLENNNLKFFSIVAPELASLYLGYNKLIDVNLDDYQHLKIIDLKYNKISSLNIKNNLISSIDISQNPIQFLDFKTTKNISKFSANQNLEFVQKNNGFKLLKRFGFNPVIIQKSNIVKSLF